MADRSGRRLRSVLRVAKRNEESAQRAFADAGARVDAAAERRRKAEERLDEVTDLGPGTVSPAELIAQRQRAALRAEGANDADQRLRELLEDQLMLRGELLGALRRRRSIENLEDRQKATHAALAAHAAQKALDELAIMRRGRKR
jgi:flagellar biosynthesis chaperone FliJ